MLVLKNQDGVHDLLSTQSFLVTVSRSVKCDVIVSKHLDVKRAIEQTEKDIFQLWKLNFVLLLLLVWKKPYNTSIIKLVCQSMPGNFVHSALNCLVSTLFHLVM